MKTKGITIFEQHVEHAVLGLAVLVFIGLTAMQFVGEPNAVTVGRDTVTPGKVDRMLKERAEALAMRLTPDAAAPVPIPDPQPILAKFEAQRSGSISPENGRSLIAWAPSINPGAGYVAVNPTGSFVVPVPKAPYQLATAQYIDTVSPEVVNENQELQKVLLHQPYDIRFVTAFAKFAAGELHKQYSTDGPNGEVRIPTKWYADRIDFINVKVERREQLDGDKWSDPIVLDPIPGQLTFRPQLATRIDAATRDQILKVTGEPNGRDIYQPDFYSTVREVWSMPGENKVVADAGNPEENAIADLKRTIEKLTRDRDALRELMKKDNCSETEPAAPDSGKGGHNTPSPSGSGGTPGGSRGGGGVAPPGGGVSVGAGGNAGGMKSGPQVGGDDTACKKHRAKLKKLNDRIEKAETELKRLQPDAPEPKPEAPKVQVVQMGDEVMIWAHDLSVQPGKTYQYRFTVEVYNPLFSHKPDLMPAQQPLADKFTLVSPTSEWSAPITTDPPLRVFITQARPTPNNLSGAGGLPLGSATAEVYRYYDGRWWKEDFTVQPGMRIGAAKTPRAEPRDPKETKDKDKDNNKDKDNKDAKPPPASAPIDYSTDWFVLDVVEDSLADRGQVDSNHAGVVLLQSLTAEGVSQVRSIRDDSVNQRQFLTEEGLSDRIGSVAVANRTSGGKTD